MSETVFGLDEEADLVYRLALTHRTADPAVLAEWLRWPVEKVRAAVQTLIDEGLCVDHGDKPEPLAPDEAALRRHAMFEQRIGDLRAAMHKDLEVLRRGDLGQYARGRKRPTTTSGVELVRGEPNIVASILSHHAAARREVRFCAPYPSIPGSIQEHQILTPRLVGSQVQVRGVWVSRKFDEVPASEQLLTLARRGGVRSAAIQPIFAMVWDRNTAVLPAHPLAPVRGALIVREPALVGLVKGHVDQCWQRATAWGPGSDGAPLGTRHRTILVLLAQGRTVESIGNHIGLSERQVRRYIAEIYQVLGVTSQVALGAEAVRRGLIT